MNNTDCSICCMPFDSTKITLLCNHVYHYNCIYQWYKTALNTKNQKQHECPYCRQDGGLLSLPDNTPFEDFIHHPAYKKHNVKSRCKATTLKGTKCKKNASDDSDFCKSHISTSMQD